MAYLPSKSQLELRANLRSPKVGLAPLYLQGWSAWPQYVAPSKNESPRYRQLQLPTAEAAMRGHEIVGIT